MYNMNFPWSYTPWCYIIVCIMFESTIVIISYHGKLYMSNHHVSYLDFIQYIYIYPSLEYYFTIYIPIYTYIFCILYNKPARKKKITVCVCNVVGTTQNCLHVLDFYKTNLNHHSIERMYIHYIHKGFIYKYI